MIEKEIRNTFTAKNLVLVGWYHSHPHTLATPTLRDIENQLDYEIQIKGPTVESYIPCIGIICCELCQSSLMFIRNYNLYTLIL